MVSAIHFRSKARPDQACCLIEGSSVADCQKIIDGIFATTSDAVFSSPTPIPTGGYVAFGRYTPPDPFSNSNDEVV